MAENAALIPLLPEGVAGRGTGVSTSSNLTRPDGVVLAKEIVTPYKCNGDTGPLPRRRAEPLVLAEGPTQPAATQQTASVLCRLFKHI